MKQPVVLIGIGEIGGVFARGLLRGGRTVVPVTRSMDMNEVAAEVNEPEAVIVAVAENDLHPVLEQLPSAWRNQVCLLQNELLPRDWQAHGLEQPTVISVWFEKKPGMDVKPLVPSPVHGPKARVLFDALDALGIPVEMLDDEGRLLFELVRKNLYILTTNIAGLVTGGTVLDLWENHRVLAIEVAEDVLDIQESLTGRKLDRKALIDAMLTAFDGDPDHKCTGRSAPARLERALRIADDADLDVPALRRILAEQ